MRALFVPVYDCGSEGWLLMFLLLIFSKQDRIWYNRPNPRRLKTSNSDRRTNSDSCDAILSARGRHSIQAVNLLIKVSKAVVS